MSEQPSASKREGKITLFRTHGGLKITAVYEPPVPEQSWLDLQDGFSLDLERTFDSDRNVKAVGHWATEFGLTPKRQAQGAIELYRKQAAALSYTLMGRARPRTAGGMKPTDSA